MEEGGGEEERLAWLLGEGGERVGGVGGCGGEGEWEGNSGWGGRGMGGGKGEGGSGS